MTEQIKKANATMGMIRRTFENLDESNLCTLFKALVRPHLEYANQIWAPFLKKTYNQYQKCATKGHQTYPRFPRLRVQQKTHETRPPNISIPKNERRHYRILQNYDWKVRHRCDPKFTKGTW